MAGSGGKSIGIQRLMRVLKCPAYHDRISSQFLRSDVESLFQKDPLIDMYRVFYVFVESLDVVCVDSPLYFLCISLPLVVLLVLNFRWISERRFAQCLYLAAAGWRRCLLCATFFPRRSKRIFVELSSNQSWRRLFGTSKCQCPDMECIHAALLFPESQNIEIVIQCVNSEQ